MEALAIYILKVNIIISGLYFFYYMVCRPQKLLIYNRFFLLGAILSCIVLPLVPFTKDIAIPERIPVFFDLYNQVSNISTILQEKILETEELSKSYIRKSATKLPFSSILLYLYLLVILGLAVRLIAQLFRVISIIKESSKYRKAGFIYCYTRKELAPFSFLHYIIINKCQLAFGEYEPITQHEEAHCQQWHSVDVLLVECLHIFLWINPFMPGFKKQLKLNLEYLADETVLTAGIHPKKYQYQILAKATRNVRLSLVNALHSKIKQRMIMMNRSASDKIHLTKYIIGFPFLFYLYTVAHMIDGSQASKSNHALHNLYNKLAGYYQFLDAKHVLIHIMNQDGKLVLEQLWNNETIPLEQEKDLSFYNASKQFPLRFIKSTDGRITRALAFEKDVWNKIDDYKSVIKHEVILSPENLKQLAGYYQYREEAKYLKITSAKNRIVLTELWTGNDIVLFPESDALFFSKQGNFPLEFVRDEQGTVIQAIAFHKDIWHKLKNKPLIKNQ